MRLGDEHTLPFAIAGPYAAAAALRPAARRARRPRDGHAARARCATRSSRSSRRPRRGRPARRGDAGADPDHRARSADAQPAGRQRARLPALRRRIAGRVQPRHPQAGPLRRRRTRSSLGPPSLIHTDVEADERGAAWLFNGCVRYAPLDASAFPAARDPCPASEVGLYAIAGSSKLRGNRARVPRPLRARRPRRCRGRLVVRLDYGTPIVARGRFDIPVGDRWVNVTVRFNRRTVARFHREGRRVGHRQRDRARRHRRLRRRLLSRVRHHRRRPLLNMGATQGHGPGHARECRLCGLSRDKSTLARSAEPGPRGSPRALSDRGSA